MMIRTNPHSQKDRTWY